MPSISLLRRSRLDRQVLPRAPFGPGAVVDRLVGRPAVSKRDARIAAETPEPQLVITGRPGSTPASREGLLEPGLVLQAAVLDDLARRAG